QRAHFAQQGHHTGHVRCGHGGAVEGDALIAAASRRREDGLAGGGDVGLEEGVAARATGREVGDRVSAPGNVEEAVGAEVCGQLNHNAGECSLQRVTYVKSGHRGGDGDGRIVAAHGDRVVIGDVVDHQHANGARILSVGHLFDEGTLAAVDERYVAADFGGVGQRRTGVGGHTYAIVGQYQCAADGTNIGQIRSKGGLGGGV